MGTNWIYALASVVIVSLISLVGIFTLSKRIKKDLIYLVSFSVGALLGDAFIHLLPEVVEKNGFSLSVSLYILSGILAFFVVEKFVHWRHCHHVTEPGHYHRFAYMNLFGDSLHNFIDGLIIGAAYLVDVKVGIATTVAVTLHEIPQEIGDFAVLVHGGFTKARALFLNFTVALTSILGVILALVIGEIEGVQQFLVPFAAGGFIYIAGSDLIPELNKDDFKFWPAFGQLFAIVFGIFVMWSLLLLEI